jgi:mRNA-degrading endonuclease HigB of HigAB toxin-antitoxin module
MVNPDSFRNEVRKRILQNYSVEFLGENFDDICGQISEPRAEKIYAWIEKVICDRIQPVIKASDKKYKQWNVYDLLTFVHKFEINGSEYRILFIKMKNSFYIEFHLGTHKYYDKLRNKLNLTSKKY